MGRLKPWHAFHPLFSGKYKKLLEDYGSKDYSKLLLQETIQDSVSYSCSQCGHIQRLEAEELNAIVGHAFRLAYAAHLQKSSGSALRDVSCATPRSSTPRSGTPSDQLHFVPSHSRSTPSSSLSNSFCHSHSNTSSTTKQLSSSASTSILHSCPLSGNSLTPSCSSSSTSSLSSCKHSFSQPLHRSCDSSFCTPCEKLEIEGESSCNSTVDNSKKTPSSQDLDIMRTPGHSPAISRHRRLSGGLNSCGFKPPTSLPILHYSDHENNLLHTPDSDTSNSPTELNTTKRLLDKPPLIKNVNLTNDSNITFDEELSPNISCDTSQSCTSGQNLGLNSLSISQNGGVVGYVNDRLNSEKAKSSDFKCRLQDEMTLKRISQLSGRSSVISEGHHLLDISSCSSHSCTPPPLPERSDSLTPPEEPHLKAAAWFQAGIPREIALEVLSREPVGAFMVRESTSKPGCYALSLRVPRDFTVSGIAHYLIVKTNKGYKIKGFTKEFITLTALITHHSVMPELLPCPLSLSRYNPTFTTEDSNRNDTNDDDPDYNTLSDFRKMMADLNV